MPSMLVIYNPAAGRGRVQAEWAQVEHSLRDAGVDFDAVATSAPLDAMRLAREAPRKYTTVISVGGDGTLHEIVNGLLQASGEQEGEKEKDAGQSSKAVHKLVIERRLPACQRGEGSSGERRESIRSGRFRCA